MKTLGLPWRQSLFQKGSNASAFAMLMRSEIQSIEGVLRVESITHSFDADNRRATFTWSVLAEEGELEGEVQYGA